MAAPHFHASGGNCGIGSLLESGKYSDLVIVCDGRNFKVHKAVLCPQSEVITRECDIDMREKNTGMIHHEEYDAATMERMLSFAYTGKYVVGESPDATLSNDDAPAQDEPVEDSATLEPDAPNDEGSAPEKEDEATCSTTGSSDGLSATEEWVAHARVYGLADENDMPHLRSYAMEQFKEVTKNVDNSDNLGNFIEVVEEVCKRTAREHNPLRDLLHELVLLHATTLACDESFLTALGERERLQNFAADMFGNLGRHMIAKTAESDKRIDTLHAKNQDLKVATDAAQESHNHTKGVMDRLVRSLESLPESCRSIRCHRDMGPFMLERCGQGDWLIRCGKRGCRCRLNF